MTKSVYTAVLFILALSYHANSQYVSGYMKDSKGEIIRYECQIPGADSALLVRSLDKGKCIEWFSAPAPLETVNGYITLVWIAGIDVNATDPHGFRLTVNGKTSFDFSSPLDTLDAQWSLKSPEGLELSFKATMVDRHGDLFGYMFLKIPEKEYHPGRSIKLKVTGETAGSRTWFMIFRYVTGQRIKIKQVPAIVNKSDGRFQALQLEMIHFGNEDTILFTANDIKKKLYIKYGYNSKYIDIPAAGDEETYIIEIKMGNRIVFKDRVVMKPVKPFVLYLLPHSHVDIGYTDLQTNVEQKQRENIKKAIEIAEKSSTYPPAARFKWNTEVMWPVECFLKNATVAEKDLFIDAVQKGSIELDGLYANLLTELCRPEELFRAFEYGREVAKMCNVRLQSAMISDIPGYTWGLIPVMAQNGIKYFSIGTNTFDRIGDILEKNGDKPFYWQSQSGDEKVLCWIHGKGYSEFHSTLVNGERYNRLKERKFLEYVEELMSDGYPYDIGVMRYNTGTDNGAPGENLPDIVRAWNEKYETPKLRISTVGEVFSLFEERYGDEIPVLRGELTGYWEDGAASSAKETGMNLASSERLTQAEILYSMLNPEGYPAAKFDSAWRYVLLFSEHTWGAWNSVSEPNDEQVKKEWETKSSYARRAAALSAELIDGLFDFRWDEPVKVIDVYNTSSWIRTGMVVLPAGITLEGNAVKDRSGNVYLSQQLSTGEFAFLASRIPPFSAKRFYIFNNSNTLLFSTPEIKDNHFANKFLRFQINPQSGNITFLRFLDFPENSTTFTKGMNGYFYVRGMDPGLVFSNRLPSISIKESGPLVNSYLIRSEAEGCNILEREVRVIENIPGIQIINTIDKKEVYDKEAVYFRFPFKLKNGKINLGIAWGHYLPGADQLPGANKNFYTVQRWADISNNDYGITFAVKEAPLLEISDITTETDNTGRVNDVSRSTTLLSYVMNNQWETNFRAAQSGKVTFNYSLVPHGRFDPVDAEKYGIELNQPLIAVPGDPDRPVYKGLLTLSNDRIIVTLIKPVDKNGGLLVRLYNPGEDYEDVRINLNGAKRKFFISDPTGKTTTPSGDSFTLPPLGIKTVIIR